MKHRSLPRVSGSVLVLMFAVAALLVAGCGGTETETTAAAVTTAPATAASATDGTASTLAATTDTTAAPVQGEYKLLFATYSSEKGFGTAGLHAFGQDLEERTNGRVKVEYSYAQALGKIPQYYDLLVNGTADVVFYSPYQTTGIFPLTEVGTLPFVSPSAQIGSQAFNAVYRAGLLDKRLYEETKTLFVCGDQGSNFRNSQKPVTELADAKGMKIMIPGGEITSARVEALGAVPVVVTGTDVYPALQKGTVVGQLTGWAPMVQFKWCEVNHYATEPLIGGSPWVVGMNWDSYNRLPEDIRQIIDEMAEDDKYMMAAADGTEALNQASRECFLSLGGQIDQWSDAALQEMGANMASVWQKWIDDNEAKGLAARDLVNAYYRALEDLGVTNPGVGYEP